MRRRHLLAAASFFGLITAANPAFAQEATPAQSAAPPEQAAAEATAAEDNEGALEEIVVTAERRTQNLQDVPISATVLGAGDLAAKGVDNIADLQQVAPAVAINTFNRSTFINIRGVGIGLSAPTSSPGIAYYIDGQLIPHEQFIGQSFFDIGSIEVLRGPQGTLTGQNSTGGAIYVRTPAPKFSDVSGYVEQVVGDYDVFRTSAAVNLGGENVALRVAAVHDERDSFTKNIGPSGTQPGNVNLDAARANLALRSGNGRLLVNLRGEFFNNDTDNNAVKNRADAVSTDTFVIEEDARGFLNQKGYRVSGEARFDLTDELQVRGITSWQDGRTLDLTDGDRTATARPRPPANAVGRVTLARTEYETFINEVNLLSTGDGPVTWVLGAFVLDETAPFTNERDNFNTVNYVSATSATLGTIYNNSKSLFGQATWTLNEKLELIGGARHSWDRQTVDRSVTIPPTYTVDTAKSREWTGKVGVNYFAGEETLLYATYSKGYKAGGVNVNPSSPDFEPETNKVIEGGFKTELVDRHLRLNGAVFRSVYDGIQFNSLLNGLPLLQNAASGKSWGGELEATGRFDALSFNFGAGYLNAEFSESVCLNNTNNPAGTRALCPSPSATSADELVPDGRVLPYSPKWTINAGVQYEIVLNDSFSITPRLQWAHTSSQLGTPFPSFRTIVPERDIVDARLTLDFGDRYKLEAFATNVFDKTYIASQIQTSSSADGGYIYGAPRQIGLRGTVKF